MSKFQNLFMRSVLLTALCVLIRIVKADLDDTFVCKRAENEELDKKRDILNEQRILQLERRVQELEDTLSKIPAIASDVISLSYDAMPRDCTQLFDAGERTDGVYQISPEGRCPFYVYCDMTNGGWTTIQRRTSADLDFRRTWDEYASGFGELDQDFWLGLEKIHRLTKGGSMIHFHLGRYRKSNRTAWAMYTGFIVHDVISGYAMNVDAFGYNGSIPELFSYHDGAKFSTFDRDQDMYSSSCSEEMGAGGGWWFASCYRLGVLNGMYGKKVKGGNAFWDTQNRFIKNTEIKIKPMKGIC